MFKKWCLNVLIKQGMFFITRAFSLDSSIKSKKIHHALEFN